MSLDQVFFNNIYIDLDGVIWQTIEKEKINSKLL